MLSKQRFKLPSAEDDEAVFISDCQRALNSILSTKKLTRDELQLAINEMYDEIEATIRLALTCLPVDIQNHILIF